MLMCAIKTWEVWVRDEPKDVNFKNHSDAEDRCEALNFEFMARKVWEGMVREMGMA